MLSYLMLVLCSLGVGALAGFVKARVIGLLHTIGELMTTLLVAGAVALAVLIGGWVWMRRT
jgi:uncharacterized membrane protein YhfC